MNARKEAAAVALFDTITKFNCQTRFDIRDASNGTLPTAPSVDEALTYVRKPNVAARLGWTVPHVRRGRPRFGQAYRYLVAGLNGQPLRPEDIALIREGTLSTVRQISTETRNQANALRMSVATSTDRKYQRWARDTATVLDGISVSARQQADILTANP
jgi:hypothetical protein